MHCHNLVHEDHDMMNQFEIQPGEAPTTTTAPTTGGTVKGRPAMAPMMMVQWELEA
jgi:hypothetical protein